MNGPELTPEQAAKLVAAFSDPQIKAYARRRIAASLGRRAGCAMASLLAICVVAGFVTGFAAAWAFTR